MVQLNFDTKFIGIEFESITTITIVISNPNIYFSNFECSKLNLFYILSKTTMNVNEIKTQKWNLISISQKENVRKNSLLSSTELFINNTVNAS